MKHAVHKLHGYLLDAAVAKVLGMELVIDHQAMTCIANGGKWSPLEYPQQAIDLISTHRVCLRYDDEHGAAGGLWFAWLFESGKAEMTGELGCSPKPIEAALHAIVNVHLAKSGAPFLMIELP